MCSCYRRIQLIIERGQGRGCFGSQQCGAHRAAQRNHHRLRRRRARDQRVRSLICLFEFFWLFFLLFSSKTALYFGGKGYWQPIISTLTLRVLTFCDTKSANVLPACSLRVCSIHAHACMPPPSKIPRRGHCSRGERPAAGRLPRLSAPPGLRRAHLLSRNAKAL